MEAAILKAAGAERVERLIDLGTGAGRMLTLLGPLADKAVGIDLSQQMLNIARRQVSEAGLCGCELRHGDIFSTGLLGGNGRSGGDPPRAALPERAPARRWRRRRGCSRPADGC